MHWEFQSMRLIYLLLCWIIMHSRSPIATSHLKTYATVFKILWIIYTSSITNYISITIWLLPAESTKWRCMVGARWKKSISLDYYDSIKEITICWKVIKFTNLQLIDLFRGHAFLPLLENPGFQFLKKQQMDGGIKVFQALWGVYPILMLTVVFIVLAGIFVWIFVSAT